MEIATPQLGSHRWRWQDIDFDNIQYERVRDDESSFYVLSCGG